MVSEAKGNLLVPVWVDAGIVKALVDNAGTIPTTESVPLTSIESQAHGYDGAAWRKQPIIWGYSDRMSEVVTYFTPGSGDYIMYFTEVPAGEVHLLNTMISQNSHKSVQHEYAISDGTNWFPIYPYGTPAINEFRFTGYIQFVMKGGDQARIIFKANDASNYLTGMIWGYKMELEL